MHILRRLAVILLATLLPLILFVLAIDASVLGVAGNPTKLEKVVADSGVYDNLVGDLLKKAKPVQDGSDSVALSSPLVRQAADKTFSANFLQTNVNKVVDGVYHWLDGQSKLPDFKVDLSQVRVSLADNLAAEVKQRVAKLPACSTTPSTFDPLTARCLPVGASPASAATKIRQNLLNGEGFLDDPVLTASDVKSGKSRKSVFADQFKQAPGIYQKVKATPLILAVLALLLIAGIFAISEHHRHSLRRVGWILVSSGILLVILAIAVNVATSKTLDQISFDNAAAAEKIRLVVSSLAHTIDKNLWLFAIGYLVIGLSLAIGIIIWERRQPIFKKA